MTGSRALSPPPPQPRPQYGYLRDRGTIATSNGAMAVNIVMIRVSYKNDKSYSKELATNYSTEALSCKIRSAPASTLARSIFWEPIAFHTTTKKNRMAKVFNSCHPPPQ